MKVRLSLRRHAERSFKRFVEARLPLSPQVTLNQSKIFIVPTRQGILLLVIAVLVLLLAINFESALNYALSFWLMAMLWVAVHQTYRNLSGLTVAAGGGTLVQVGDVAEIRLRLLSASGRNRGAIEFLHESWGSVMVDTSSPEVAISIPMLAEYRGPVTLPRFRIESRFPFGLVVAWSNLRIDAVAWAYPKAVKITRRSGASGLEDEQDQMDDHFFRSGNEDFHSLKSYAPGDAIHRLHWPGFSRGQLMVKSFTDYQSADQRLDWSQFNGHPDEQRLAAIAFYSEQFFLQDLPYSVSLPGSEIPPGKGHDQLHRVRRALAEFGYVS